MSTRASVLIASLGVVLAILLVFMAMPGERENRPASEPTVLDPVVMKAAQRRRTVKKVPTVEAVLEDTELELPPLDEDPAINVVTGNCRKLIGMQRRGVPQFTILDQLRDSSMRFHDDDMQCLSAGGALQSVLSLAQNRYSSGPRKK